MEILISSVISLALGVFIGFRFIAGSLRPELSSSAQSQAIDRANYLQTLRRELANILIWRDPGGYLELYKTLHTETKSFASWRPDAIKARLAELYSKYPNYSDFDLIATREFVLYPRDNASSLETSDIQDRYKDIIQFETLSLIGVEGWKAAGNFVVHITDDKELAYLHEYVLKVRDTQFKIRLAQAVDFATLISANSESASCELDNDFYLVRRLPSLADVRYGIHIKSTNEFGIYSFFVFDDGRIHNSYYRSDPLFQLEQPLDVIPEVFEEFSTKR
jgi:hypothetical protein